MNLHPKFSFSFFSYKFLIKEGKYLHLLNLTEKKLTWSMNKLEEEKNNTLYDYFQKKFSLSRLFLSPLTT